MQNATIQENYGVMIYSIQLRLHLTKNKQRENQAYHELKCCCHLVRQFCYCNCKIA